MSGRCRPYLQNRIWASRNGPARPRAIGCEGACVCAIVSQSGRRTSRACWITFQHDGTCSNVSLTSSPIFSRNVLPPQHGHEARCRVDDALARQMLRQRTARRPLASEAFDLDLRRSGCRGSQPGLRLGFGSILFQIGELKLELFEDCAAFRRLAVLLVRSLAIGNFICSISSARAFASASAFCAFTFAARRAAPRRSGSRSRRKVVGSESAVRVTPTIESRIRSQRAANAPNESTVAFNYPAACGRHVRCGARQSMPSSR